MVRTSLLWLSGFFLFVQANAQEVDYSLQGGWYDHPVELRLVSEGETIFYTTNGNSPRPGQSEFHRPITLTSTTLVRAIACTGRRCGPETAHTFFINEPKSAFPTLSVAVPPYALFDPESGIYREGWFADNSTWKKPGANFWSKKELPAHTEIFDADGEQVFNANTGFRLFGGMSRLFAQKSFSLVARAKYGHKRIDYPMFGRKGLNKFKYLVLRNSGSDWGKTQFRDALMTSLLNKWDLEKQDYQPAHVYLNGQYWGLYNAREKINRFFLEGHTGTDRDSIDLLEHNAHAKVGTSAHYKRMLDYIRLHDLAVDSHFVAVGRMMDIDNFMHYQIAQIFFDNQDAGGNIRFWRPRTPVGRWRWILYDTDWGFGLNDSLAYRNNSLAFHTEPNGPSWPNPPWSTYLLRQLLRNDQFRETFIRNFYDLLNQDFHPDRVIHRIDRFADQYRPEIPRHFDRWNLDTIKWETQVAIMRQFARKRPGFMRQFLQEQFGLGEDVNFKLGCTAGGEMILSARHHWEADTIGLVYPNGMSITVQIKPRSGFRFVGWSDGAPLNQWTRTIEAHPGMQDLTARFEPFIHPLADKVMINEIGAYNRQSGDWVEIFNSSDQSVDITSWILADAKHEYRLPTAVIPPGGYLVFCQDLGKFKKHFPGVPAAAGTFSFGLNKRSESITLYTEEGAWVDQVSYTVTPVDTAFTLALLIPDLNNDLPKNWELRVGQGTPGAGNPYYIQMRVKDRQTYWMRLGLGFGLIALLSGLFAWKWRHDQQRIIQNREPS
ncbi:MAG: CotH kinase family protein [Saprospiraceae bacterium]|nr:CotH kinase family protein [Saprospiraceae bacterium]